METINFDNWTARCHYLGDLMTPAKGKSNLQKYNEAKEKFEKKHGEWQLLENRNTKTAVKLHGEFLKAEIEMDRLEPIKDVPNLSLTCKTRLIQVYTEITTGRTKNIKGKFLDKGLHVEEDSLTAFSMLQKKMYRKNKERRDNGFINGECDLVSDEEDLVGDTKSNWEIFTFDKVAISPILSLYNWQLDGYMWLWNKSKAKLIYTLQNTPEFLLNNELKKIEYQLPEDQWEEAKAEVKKLHTYDDLPLERKVRIFDVKRKDDRIDQIKETIVLCRKFLNSIENIKTTNNDDQTDYDDE